MTLTAKPPTAHRRRPTTTAPTAASARPTRNADPAHVGPRRRAVDARLPRADALRVLRLQLVADRAVGDHEPAEDQPASTSDWVGLRQLRARAQRPAARHGDPQHPLLRAARAALRVPAADLHGRAHERGAAGKGFYSALAYLPVVIPPVVAVLLWKFFYDAEPDRRLQHDPRLGRHPAAAVAPVVGAGDALARARGDVGGRRRLDHHLPRRAAQRAARAVRRGRGRRRRHLAQDLARHAAAAARHPLHHADPAGHRDRAGVPRAVPLHRRRTEQRDRHDPAAHLPLRLPEQPGRRLRRGDRAQRDARDRARAALAGCTSSSPNAGAPHDHDPAARPKGSTPRTRRPACAA